MNVRNNAGKIAVIIVSIAILVILAILMVQRTTNYVALQTQIHLEQNLLDQEKQRLDELVKLSQNEQAIKDTIAACRELMPGEPSEDELIKHIQGKADDAMADFVQIRFEPRVQAGSVVQMPIQISFEGNYTSLLDFLKTMRNGERAIRVDRVAVNQTGNDTGNIRAELGASAFYTGTISAAADTGSTAASNASAANTAETSTTETTSTEETPK